MERPRSIKRFRNDFLRKRDLLTIRVADWRKDSDEPAIDVEVYRKGKYMSEESKTISCHIYRDVFTEVEKHLKKVVFI